MDLFESKLSKISKEAKQVFELFMSKNDLIQACGKDLSIKIVNLMEDHYRWRLENEAAKEKTLIINNFATNLDNSLKKLRGLNNDETL
jgi:hypothetical protein